MLSVHIIHNGEVFAQVNPKADFRKLSQSVSFSNAAVDIRREVLSDKTKKVFLFVSSTLYTFIT